MKMIRNKLLFTAVAFAVFAISFAVLWQGAGMTAFASSVAELEEKQISTATLEDDFAENRILVVMDRQSTMSFENYSKADFSNVGVASVEELTKTSSEALREQMSSARIGRATRRESMEINADKFRTILCLTLEQAGKENVLEIIRVLEQRDDIISAEPDAILHIESTNPNDPRFRAGDQWGLNGTAGINAPNAWAISTGISTVRVGVIDTGIDASHPDLVVNTSMSRDFSLASPHIPTSITDSNGHGTHVAGIIGATGNNGVGVTGVAQNVELISLRISPTNLGDSFASHLISAVNYATTEEIPILSNSNGTDSFTGSTASRNALETAIDGYPGLFVTSAGNAGRNNDNNANRFPSNIRLPNVISVGASDKNGNRSNWNGFGNLWGLFGLTESSSNFGATMVDIFAPGTDILSTLPNNKYQTMSGTSMATPFVSGVAALLLSHNENLTAAEIRAAILDTATPVTALNNLCVTGGRLNADAALRSVGYFSTPIGTSEIRIDGMYFNPSEAFVIPDKLNGRTVTGIGNYAFAYYYDLNSLTVPASVTSVGYDAFYECPNLSITWNYNPALSWSVFDGRLGTLKIPSIITEIPVGAFMNCTSLKKVVFEDNSQLVRLRNDVFNGCSALQSISFGDNSQLRSIEYGTLSHCTSLTSVDFGYNSRLNGIYSGAFYWCTALKTVSLPSSLTHIGPYAFENCVSLESNL